MPEMNSTAAEIFDESASRFRQRIQKYEASVIDFESAMTEKRTKSLDDLSREDAEDVARAGGGLIDNPHHPRWAAHEKWNQAFLQTSEARESP